MIIFHHSLFFYIPDFGTCHVCGFYFLFLQAQAAVTENTARRSEENLQSVSSLGRAVFTGIKCSQGVECVCVYITLHFSPLPLYQHQSCCPRLLQSPGPQCALWVFSLWALVHPSTCRENKSSTGFYRTPGEYTKKKKNKRAKFLAGSLRLLHCEGWLIEEAEVLGEGLNTTLPPFTAASDLQLPRRW